MAFPILPDEPFCWTSPLQGMSSTGLPSTVMTCAEVCSMCLSTQPGSKTHENQWKQSSSKLASQPLNLVKRVPEKWGLNHMFFSWQPGPFIALRNHNMWRRASLNVSHPSYSFHNVDVPLESEKLEFHRWITELNCALTGLHMCKVPGSPEMKRRAEKKHFFQTQSHGQQLEFAWLLIQLIFRSRYCIFPRAKRQ